MVKENIDSHAALMLLSRLLHAPSSAFAVAGTKDKRAVTVQQVTAHKVQLQGNSSHAQQATWGCRVRPSNHEHELCS